MCCFPRHINCCWRKKESLRPNSNSWNARKSWTKSTDFATQRALPLVQTRFPWKFSVITCTSVKLGVVQQCLQLPDQHWSALLAQILKVKLLKRKKLRKSVIRQVLIFRSGKQNLSKTVSFWLHRHKAREILYWRRKRQRLKIMKMEASGGKSCVLFVTLQDTTRTNAAMVHVKEFPPATTAINIQRLEQKYKTVVSTNYDKTLRPGSNVELCMCRI